MVSTRAFVFGFVLGGVIAGWTVYALRSSTRDDAHDPAAIATFNAVSNARAIERATPTKEFDPGVPTTKQARGSTDEIDRRTTASAERPGLEVSGNEFSGRRNADLQERKTKPTNLVQPIPVPEELRSVLEEVPGPDEEITMKKAHRLVSGQKKDDQWAWQMEQYFLEFFANHPLGATVDLWLVECRTSFCEIQLASYGDSAKDNVGLLIHDMQSDPRVGGYTSQWASTSENNGILYFAHILNWQNLNP